MKILLIGDIVGRPGRGAIKKGVPALVAEHGIDCVIANAENAAGGLGLTPALAKELFAAGVTIITGGNHIWKRRELLTYLDECDRIIRPANYPKTEYIPGRGWLVTTTTGGVKIGVLTLLGRVFMKSVECPFRVARESIAKIKEKTDIIIVEIHAEATSEKVALGRFLDGKVAVVFGTHTHVQTSDNRILTGGTAYMTDIGMTGPHESVIGQETKSVLEHFITQLPVAFKVAENDVHLEGAIVTIDPARACATSIEAVRLVIS